MPIDYQCDCGAVLSLAEGQRGTEVECPQCSRRFTLPEDFASEAGPARKPRYVAWLVGVGVAAAFLLVALLLNLSHTRTRARPPHCPFPAPQDITLITAEAPFEERTFLYKEIINAPIDPDTGYRRIEGELWSSPMECASSELDGNPHRIPVPPWPVIVPDEEEKWEGEKADRQAEEWDAKPYPCPVCGKEANPYVLYP